MRSILKHILLFLLHASVCTACSSNQEQHTHNQLSQQKSSFPYDLEKPDSKIFLPFVLEEISGIAYMNPGNLACVQDEKGVIYTYNLREEKITKEDHFGKGGDYEDIEIVKDHAYVVRSDGQLWKLQPGSGVNHAQTYKTPLSSKNDVEGLAYDAANNRLLLACKGASGLKKNIHGFRTVYAFDLQTNRLIEDPVFSVSVDAVKQRIADKLYNEDFRPSGIAVHPVSGQVYMLASVGKVLIVLDKNGMLQDVYPLNADDFKQPEGICFSPDGTLFISNEGRGGRATILQFNYAKP